MILLGALRECAQTGLAERGLRIAESRLLVAVDSLWMFGSVSCDAEGNSVPIACSV